MHEIKHTDAEHRERGSDTTSHDIEKRAHLVDHNDTPRDDDAVTAKTWAVVFVCYSSLIDLWVTITDMFQGTCSILRYLVLACAIFQHHPVPNGYRARL